MGSCRPTLRWQTATCALPQQRPLLRPPEVDWLHAEKGQCRLLVSRCLPPSRKVAVERPIIVDDAAKKPLATAAALGRGPRRIWTHPLGRIQMTPSLAWHETTADQGARD